MNQMEQVIKALEAIPEITWGLSCYHMSDGARYNGHLHYSTGNVLGGESTTRSYNTVTQSDPHDVLVELLGVALKWQDQGESQA